MSGVHLAIRGLVFRYPNASEPVLDGVNLTVDAGERVAVLGPNGSGKTTLILHLNGLLEIQTGEITVADTPVQKSTYETIRRRVGLVFQHADDQLFMPTVREDVGFGPANLGLGGEERQRVVDRSLQAVDASDLAERSPHHLSGGEKRRIAIATILAMDPELVVFDEPTAGLDPVGKRELAELMTSLPQTQLVVTHDLPFVLATCPRSVILDQGRIVADAPTAELLADTERLASHRLELPFGYSMPSPKQERHHPESAV